MSKYETLCTKLLQSLVELGSVELLLALREEREGSLELLLDVRLGGGSTTLGLS